MYILFDATMEKMLHTNDFKQLLKYPDYENGKTHNNFMIAQGQF